MLQSRKLPSWIDGFIDYTSKIGSPELFCKWSAIYTVAAAMERKVWMISSKGILYPNMYVVLVGPAGAGKTNALHKAYEFMAEMEDAHVAPTNISRASLIDALEEAHRSVCYNDASMAWDYNSLAIYSNELGTFIPEYGNDLISVLTDLYDCKRFVERKRVLKKSISMVDPQLNLLAATTPSYLNALLPEGAWEQGFISRTILVYSGMGEPVDPFTQEGENDRLRDELLHDLRQIYALKGSYKWHEDAKDAYRNWAIRHNCEPAPTHPKLNNYLNRRQAHLFKICMAVAAAQSNDMEVTIEHYREALNILVEVEKPMGDIFKAMVSGGAEKVMKETWHWAYGWTALRQFKTPVPKELVLEYLAQRAAIGDVSRYMDNMITRGILKATISLDGRDAYTVMPFKQE